ncbi:MAG: iron ABC transporter permease [Nitrososphaerota archaeon]|nr:iron ABC transporter permease [Nitrososphaerota archaeon]
MSAASQERARARALRLSPALLALGVGTAVLGVFIVYPIAFTVLSSFWSGQPGEAGHYTLANYSSLLSDRHFYSTVLNTFVQAGSSALMGIGLGTLLSLITVRTDTPLRGALFYLPYLPLAFPVLIANQAWIYIFERRVGLVNILLGDLGLSRSTFNIYSWPGIVFASGMALAPICYVIISAAMRNMDSSLEEASRASGSGARDTLLRVSMPLMSPSIVSAFLLAFTLSAGSFETPTMIGIPAGISLMMSSVYDNASAVTPPNYAAASTESVLLLAIIMAMVYLYNRSLRRSRRFEVVSVKGYSAGRVISLGRWRYVAFAVILAYLAFAVALPAFTIAVLSLVPIWLPNALFAKLSLANYAFLFSGASGAAPALLNSLIASVVAATAIAAISLAVLFVSRRTAVPGRGFLEAIAMFPVSLPALVIGFGLLWAFLTIKTGLYGTLGVMVIALSVSLLPQGVRVLSGGVVQIQTDLQEAARASGAGTGATIRRVFFPLVRSSLAAAWLYVFIGSFTALGAVLFLTSVNNQLFSTLLWSYYASGNLGASETFAAGSVLLLVIMMLAVSAMVLAQRRFERGPPSSRATTS